MVKIATLPSVRAFDHANPCEGLQISLKMHIKSSNFTSRSCVRPRQSLPIPVKGCKFRLNAHEKKQFYLAFVRSTTPIPANPCEGLQISPQCTSKVATLPSVRALDPPIPVKGCKVHALDHANPCEGLQSAPRNVSLYFAFVRSTLPIPVKGCKVRRTMCHFTSRSCARPRESL